MISRRHLIAQASTVAIASAFLPLSCAFAGKQATRLEKGFAAIESEIGGQLGVAMLDTGTGLRAARNGNERFPMCSTFKLLAVAAVLKRVDDGKDLLSRKIPVPADAILEYAPVTQEHAGGSMTLSDLCAAAMVWSDNTAANLILEVLGGPAGATAYVRTLGDTVTRIDRMEPQANNLGPGEVRDTTSPNAMLGDLDKLFLGDALSPLSRDRLTGWFVACETGKDRIKAGMPETWRIGDRTGTGPHGTSNDIAIAWPTGGKPILITAFITGSPADEEARDAALAKVGHLASTMIS